MQNQANAVVFGGANGFSKLWQISSVFWVPDTSSQHAFSQRPLYIKVNKQINFCWGR